jgi:hypothetical protein
VGSSGKKRTTMAKMNREQQVRTKRAQKQARKAARKLTAASDADEATADSAFVDEDGERAAVHEPAGEGLGSST